MCRELNRAERKVLVDALTAGEHLTIIGAWIDLRVNYAKNWERFYNAHKTSTGLRVRAGLPEHAFLFGCCAPPGIDDHGFVKVLGIFHYGLNPVDHQQDVQDTIDRFPPKRPKSRKEALERDAELTKARNELYQRMYEGALG